jgi:hypothetical protein
MKEQPVSSAKKDLEKLQKQTEEAQDRTDSSQLAAAGKERTDGDEKIVNSVNERRSQDGETKVAAPRMAVSPKVESEEGRTVNKNVKKVQEKDRAKVSGNIFVNMI